MLFLTCSRRSTDRTRPCGGRDVGSIPAESTKGLRHAVYLFYARPDALGDPRLHA